MKSEILKNESEFQRACRRFVEANIITCASSLFSVVAGSPHMTAELFDEDVDDLCNLAYVNDYEEPARYFIEHADVDDLETIVDEYDWWADMVEETGVSDVYEVYLFGEDPHLSFSGAREVYETEYQAYIARNEFVAERVRPAVVKLVEENSGAFEWVCNEFNLDPEEREVFEYWIVDQYFASELEDAGEKVVTFLNWHVWCRTTTGQSISMDYVIREIVRGLDEHHWVWRG
jgi:hypothetical protein